MPSDPGARWQRRKDARPAEILAAALACFKERGFTATRLEDVAAKAGVTKGTIYLYYCSKEELFKAVVRGELVPNIERMEAAVQDAPVSAAALLEQLCTFWVQDIVPSPISVIPKLVIAEAGNFPELARFYLETAVRRGIELIAAILRRGIASGEFRPVDVEHAAYCVIGPLLFTVLWQHSLGPHDDRPLNVQAVCRTHLDLLLHGLRMPTPLARPDALAGGEGSMVTAGDP
jgi:AcrR family transcriptional regulator